MAVFTATSFIQLIGATTDLFFEVIWWFVASNGRFPDRFLAYTFLLPTFMSVRSKAKGALGFPFGS
jgi:hypothetical protein